MTRNLRKTRKNGGAIASTVLLCPKLSYDTCLQKLLKDESFTRHRVPGDGNCFYHAIVKFFQLSDNVEFAGKTHLDIRNIVVDKMETDMNEVIPFLVVNNSNIEYIKNVNRNEYESALLVKYFESLETLREDGMWHSDIADLVSQYASKALNMTIKIYDFKAPEKAEKRFMTRKNNGTKVYNNIPAEPRKVVCYTFPPEGVSHKTIHLLRIADGHYELLYKNDEIAPIASIRRRPKVAPVIPNIIANTSNKLKEMKINIATSNKTISVKKLSSKEEKAIELQRKLLEQFEKEMEKKQKRNNK